MTPYAYRYQNRAMPFFGGPINRGLHGMGDAELDAMRANAWAQGGIPLNSYGNSSGGGGGSTNETISAVGGALLNIGTGYSRIVAAQRGGAGRSAFLAPPPAAPVQAGFLGNMSTTTKLVLAGVAALVLVPIAMKAMR